MTRKCVVGQWCLFRRDRLDIPRGIVLVHSVIRSTYPIPNAIQTHSRRRRRSVIKIRKRERRRE